MQAIVQTQSPGNVFIELKELDERKKELLVKQKEIQEELDKIYQREKEILAAQGIRSLSFHASVLVINNKRKNKIDQASHYDVFLRVNGTEMVQTPKFPIDITKYGQIQQIIIADWEGETALQGNDQEFRDLIGRLIKYLSTDFDELRKDFSVDPCSDFNTEEFSYYLKYGTKETYPPLDELQTHILGCYPRADYRNMASHLPGGCYSIEATSYKSGTTSHHYVCLTKNVFVSKSDTGDILFTSFQHILDSHFPPEFKNGTFAERYVDVKTSLYSKSRFAVK